MKLENFNLRPMREVEYFGVKISIPADHLNLLIQAEKAV